MSNLAEYFKQKGTILRRAADADVPALVNIINDAYSYQDSAKGQPRTDPRHLMARIEETDFYVLEKKTEVIGCVYLEPRDDSLHFGLLTLIPALRKTGLGKAIVEAVTTYSSVNNYRFIELDYMSLAPWLKKYYERYGFKETGEVTEWGSINLIRMRMKVQSSNLVD